jgi:putative ATP-binding cassette transporter
MLRGGHSWNRVLALCKPLFTSTARWRAIGALATVLGLALALNALNVVNSYVGRNFMTAISHRDHSLYARFALLYFAVFMSSTVVGVVDQFVQDRLALLWRHWLTRDLVARYMSGHTLERIRDRNTIDNPDQRITDDVRTFTSTFLSFVVMIVNALLTTIAFAGVLWSITPRLLIGAVLYASFGTVLTIALGWKLVDLNHMQLEKEADLRYALVHLRVRRKREDDVAARVESRHVRSRLRRVIHNSRAIIGVTRNVAFFTSGYNYLVQLVPILIVAPRYLRGEVEFGVVTQSAMAFAQILGAFSIIVAQFQALSAFAAVIRRLGSLSEELDRA